MSTQPFIKNIACGRKNGELKTLTPGFQVGGGAFFSGSQRRSGGVLMVSNNGIHQIPSAAEQIAHILFTDLVLSDSTTIAFNLMWEHLCQR